MDTLLVAHGPVTTITLNRPDVRNALSAAMIAELTTVAATLAADPALRVVVLRGAGAAFCAGADLHWMSAHAAASLDENLADARRAGLMFHALDTLPVPVIGRVHGAALGGGAGLVALCDLVVAADDAVFGLPETTIGLLPALIAPYVVRKIGISGARAVCLTGERFGTARAMAMGLIHECVPAHALDETVDRIVGRCLRAEPSAVAACKRVIAQVAGRDPGDVLALTTAAIATQRVSPAGQAGMRAFLDKRQPPWHP